MLAKVLKRSGRAIRSLRAITRCRVIARAKADFLKAMEGDAGAMTRGLLERRLLEICGMIDLLLVRL